MQKTGGRHTIARPTTPVPKPLPLEDGPVAGGAAVTRHPLGRGDAWYVGTRLDADSLGQLLHEVYRAAGIKLEPGGRGVEVMTRTSDAASWLFVVNHTDQPAEVPTTGRELLTDTEVEDVVVVPAGGVRVGRETSAAHQG